MSERSSFVTDYIYCKGCLDKLKVVLLLKEKYLTGIQIPTWKDGDDDLPIIAGKIGSLGPMGEYITLMDLFNTDNAPCHPVRISILHDCGDSVTYTISPSGTVDVSSAISAN